MDRSDESGMSNGFAFLDIIFFAMVAAFLVLRLRNVLGRRTGNERRRPDLFSRRGEGKAPVESPDKVVRLPDRGRAKAAKPAGADAEEAGAEGQSPLDAGLTQISDADSAFAPGEFVDGARAAFEMIVEAFAAGNRKALRPLLSEEVYDNFTSAIEARENAGETLETTVVGIDGADLIEASMDGSVAYVTVKFVSEQINVTRDKNGEVVDGDPNHVAEVTDIWTFGRDTRSRDPNWALVETRSPN